MPQIVINMDKAEQAPVLPEGDYRLEIKKIVEKTADKGVYLAVEFRVVEGDFEDWPIFDNISTAEGAQWRLAQFGRACGIVNKGQVEMDTNEFLGIQLMAKVVVEELPRTGRKQARPARYYMTEETKRAIDQPSTPEPEAKQESKAPARATASAGIGTKKVSK